jgi:tRNA nucleotidyltransferase/poly(A) polymerase
MITKIDLSSIEEVCNKVERWIGITDFYLYGGVITDIILLNKNKFHDYDIAILNCDSEQYLHIFSHLKLSGFEIYFDREYHILKDYTARLIYAKKDNILLDLVFLEDLKYIGVLTQDSIYFNNNTHQLIDQHTGYNDLNNNIITLCDDAYYKEPLTVVKRILNTSSKHRISLLSEDIIGILSKLDYDLNQYDSHIFNEQFASLEVRLIKTILNSKNQNELINELIQMKFMELYFPMISNILQRMMLSGNLLNIKTMKDFVCMSYKLVETEREKDELFNCFSYFRFRYWEPEIFKLSHLY